MRDIRAAFEGARDQMAIEVGKIGRDLVLRLDAYLKGQSGGWLWVKLIFIVCASALAAVAQFMTGPTPADFGPWNVIGVSAALVAGVGGIILAVKEKDSGAEMALAHEALEAARTLQMELAVASDEYEGMGAHLDRLKELYLAIRAMRSVLESAKGVTLSDVDLIGKFLDVSKRSLTIALDFQNREHWTLAVYRGEKDTTTDRWRLRCLATHRSMPCDVKLARLWPEESVPVGVCFLSGQEQAIPDSMADGMGTIIEAGGKSRLNDRDIYRSMFAAPILIEGRERAWGVVVATSSRPDHFTCDGPIGVRTSEAVRTLADMIALALVVQDPAPTEATP